MLAPTGLITTGDGGLCGDYYLAKSQCGIALDSWQPKEKSGVNASLGSFPLSAVNTSCTTGMTEAPEQPEQYRWGVSCAFGMQTEKSEKSGAGGSFAAFYVSFRSNNSGSIDAQLTIHWQHHDECTEPPPKVAVYQRTISRCPTCENGDIVSFGPSHYICGTRYCGTDATYKFKAYCDCGTPKTKSGTGSSTSTETYTFPADERCMYITGSTTATATVVVTVSGSAVWDSGSITGAFSRCFNKPQGVTAVQVEVTGSSGSSWSYTLECDACPPPTVAPPCCRDRGASCDGGVTVRYCSPAPPPDTSSCANSSSLPECDTETCTATGVNPGPYPPYDCVNGAFAFGAYVHVSGWSSCFECTGLSPELEAVFAEIDSVVNQTWYVPITCLGNATKTYTFPGGSEVGGEWTVTVFVDLCNRDCTVTFSNPVGIGTTVYELELYLSDLTKTDSPCNSFQVCSCVAYSGGDVGGSGNGTLTVNSSP
jgi:hypothetical protein